MNIRNDGLSEIDESLPEAGSALNGNSEKNSQKNDISEKEERIYTLEDLLKKLSTPKGTYG